MNDFPNYTPEEIRRMNRIEAIVLISIAVIWIAFMILWNYYRPLRERAAYEEGVRAADRKAEAAGGWDAYIAAEVAKVAAQ